MYSITQAKERKKLSISQRQAITKLIEISLLNVDIKVLSKALSKNVRGFTMPIIHKTNFVCSK